MGFGTIRGFTPPAPDVIANVEVAIEVLPKVKVAPTVAVA
ncbi:hypothetical protein LCGC14_1266570, partial [marine sediment metagenome]